MNELFELYTVTKELATKAKNYIDKYPKDSTISYELMDLEKQYKKALKEFERRHHE